jgi:NAD(P)-dependent dehydrogenase (short-subunit alcohol dehydrogenase family)
MLPEGDACRPVWANDDVRRTPLANVPSRRFGREEEVANACAYLVSD